MTLEVADIEKTIIDEEYSRDELESNWALVRQLDHSIGASTVLYGTGAGLSLGLLLMGGWALFAVLSSLHPIYSHLFQISKLTNIKKVLTNILEEFKDENDLKIHGCIEVDNEEPLDLFAIFNKKANFFISVRSKGKSKLFYDAEKDCFYGRRKGSGRQKWRSHLSGEMRTYVRWVSKHRQLFNISSRQVVKVHHARIVVICKPTEIADHNDEFYSIINGDEKILTIHKTFFVGEENVTKLIKAFLTNQIEYPKTIDAKRASHKND